jgi:1-deoxy-D-xylulose-5-phosphate reductoisomerase
LKKLEFEPVSVQKFPCLRLAREAAKMGGPAPCALNAADEEAVAAFLEGKLNFTGIAVVIEKVLEKIPSRTLHSIEDVLDADSEARRLARQEIARRKN